MCRFLPTILCLVLCGTPALRAAEPSAADLEFFEKEIRPLLVERCFECHGDKKTKGGLKVTSKAALLRGGDSGPAAVTGKPEASLLIQAVHYKDDLRMPPKAKLPAKEIDALTRWVKLGLPWPEGGSDTATQPGQFRITDEQRRFWAFQPVKAVAPPAVKDAAWAKSDIDRFILAGLEAKGLRPAKPADKRTLIRRVTFDLTGLPPTPEEIDAFLKDDSPEAFAKVVDRLLASPAYGERWGRHWLDVVRYCDSADSRDGPGTGFSEAWHYRDWVVRAFNRDLPYDQFLIHQLAGDLLPPKEPGTINTDGLTATGVLVIGNWGGGDADKEKLLTDIVDDQIDLVGRSVLGLTLSCARCHDHKFDPISTQDYYGLAGIFFSTHILPNVGPKTAGPPINRIPLVPQASVERHQRYQQRLGELDRLIKANSPDGIELASALDYWRKHPVPAPPVAHAALEGGVPGSPHAGVHDVRVHIRGSYSRLGDMVPRRFPLILAGERQERITRGSGRMELAKWLTRPDHPLTARVMVNRLWQHHFGQGIVRTPSNFGDKGERPTHPELLDYLAARFVETGWSMKTMHRTLLMTSAYQQASEPLPETLKADADNRLLGRMNRVRLEAEPLRDSLLAVAGRLDRTTGGPAAGNFNTPRRTLYLATVRSDRSGYGALFDVADSTAPVDQRTVSTVAPQALFLLNHPFVAEQSKALAKRTERLALNDERAAIASTYTLLYGRPPSAEETRVGSDFLARARRPGVTAEQAWEQYCHILLCANEFIYID